MGKVEGRGPPTALTRISTFLPPCTAQAWSLCQAAEPVAFKIWTCDNSYLLRKAEEGMRFYQHHFQWLRILKLSVCPPLLLSLHSSRMKKINK